MLLKTKGKKMFPIKGNYDIIKSTLNKQFESVLDIGLGDGGAANFYVNNGKKVTSIGLDIDNYNVKIEELREKGVEVIETIFEDFNEDKKFDFIWASHVLEHNNNIGLFLNKAKRLLTEEGYLCVVVPPYKTEIVGGHITTGWTIGQLMYNLLLEGFDIKNGNFVSHKYNVCAIVGKRKDSLPNLRMDIGDLETLKEFWPIEIKQMSEGDLLEVNWFKKIDYEIEKWPTYKDKIEELHLKIDGLHLKIEEMKDQENVMRKKLKKYENDKFYEKYKKVKKFIKNRKGFVEDIKNPKIKKIMKLLF